MIIEHTKKLFIILFISLCFNLYATNLLNEIENQFWISIDYVKALEERNRDYLIKKYPDFDWFYKYYDDLEGKQYQWYENTSCIEGLQLYNGNSAYAKQRSKEYIGKNGVKENCNIITYKTEKSVLDFFIYNNYTVSNNKIFIKFAFENLDNAVIIPKKAWVYDSDKEDEITLILDNDFLQLYYCGNYIHTFCKLDEKTFNELKSFLKNGKFNISNITWPRHADGSCDYDGSKTAVATQTANSTASTNVAKNKTMTVSENLKLRAGEATSSQVLTVMSAGTKVKILELGKVEKIDGISSNWVKVEVQKGAKDRDGNPIKPGTVGWSFGGFLE